MPRATCKCSMSRVLPRGLICDRGYLFIRLFPGKGRKPHLEGCQPHTSHNEKLATIKLNDYRKEIFLGRFNAQSSGKAITVDEALDLYIKFAEASKNIQGVIARILRPTFGRYPFHELPPSVINMWREKRLETCLVHATHKENVDKKTCRMIKFSTVNREQTALHSVYSSLIKWVKLEKTGVPRVLLPAENPCKEVQKPSEKIFSRKRVPEREELKAAKAWCMEHDKELWQTIFRATVTMLRKSDFKAQQESGNTDGVQGKTGLKFKVRANFPNPIGFVNWRKRWEALQKAMGWTEFTADGKPNARHTVWHDIRHWGPSLLGEAGFSSDFIRRLTGHASSEMADHYTHLRESKLEEAVGLISKEMEQL